MSKYFNPVETQQEEFKPSTLSNPISALDVAIGGVDPVIPVTAILGISNFNFEFFNEGGTDNLKPGRPTTQTKSLEVPRGTTNGFICLRTISGAFVTDGGVNLTQRPLGQFLVDVYFGENNTINCTIVLSDSNSDDPVQVFVRGTVVYFQ